MSERNGWIVFALFSIILLIIGSIIGHFLFPRVMMRDRIGVETPVSEIQGSSDEQQVGSYTFGNLEVYLDETKGEVLISGLSVGNLWLGRVSGPSMFPTMGDGSAVIIEEIHDINSVKVGDIIIFNNPYNNEYVAHRVSSVGYNGEQWYADTLADNKNVSSGIDELRVYQYMIWGKVRVYLDY